jgi:tetratricopeptide (TPR) repeat protein
MPDAPPAAGDLLASAMGSDPEKRPGSAGALVDGLEQALGGTRRHPSLPPRTQRQPFVPPDIAPRRSRTRAAAVLAGGVAAGVVIGVLVMSGLGGSDERAPTLTAAPALANDSATADNSPAREPATQAPAPTPEPAPAPEPPPEETAVAAAPSSGGADLNSQGYALIQQGRYDEAIPILQQAVDSFPAGTTDINYAYALFNLGNALRLGGRPEEAIPVLEQRLQIPNQTATVERELELARAAAGD